MGNLPKFQYNYCLPTLLNLKLCCDHYEIFPELTLQGNIHFHGILEINDKIKWYKKVLPSLKYMGFVLIKPKPDKNWEKYMSKDSGIMEVILKPDWVPSSLLYYKDISRLKR